MPRPGNGGRTLAKGPARDFRNIHLSENIRQLVRGITPSRTCSLKHRGHRLLQRAPAKNQKSIVRCEHCSGYSGSVVREGSKETSINYAKVKILKNSPQVRDRKVFHIVSFAEKCFQLRDSGV